jgi:hypothetical protein
MSKRVLLLSLLLCALPSKGAAAERTFPLTAKEVRCAARQLARVQRRLTSVGAGIITTDMGNNALWNVPNASGHFSGLVRLLNQGDSRYRDFLDGQEHFAEADLAFDLIFKSTTSTLDPHQPPRPQATLVRRNLGTNLVLDHAMNNSGDNPGCCFDLEVNCSRDLGCPMVLNFDLAAVPGDSVFPSVPLVINNASAATPDFSGPQALLLPSASGTGPGIVTDRLDQSCGGRLTAFDAHVFEILARTIVPSNCYTLGPSDCQNVGAALEAYNLAIFRGADPHTYRVDIYFVQYLCFSDDCYSTGGPLALEFHVNWDAQGRLTTGDVDVLPACRAGESVECSNPVLFNGLGIFLVPPIFPGNEEETPTAFHGAPYLNPTRNRTQQVLHAEINWAALLRSTALNHP